MFTTPTKIKPQNNSNSLDTKGHHAAHTSNMEQSAKQQTTIGGNTNSRIFENGTMLGAVIASPNNGTDTKLQRIIPQIVISASYSSNSLNRSHSRSHSHCDLSPQHHSSEDNVAESTALLETHLETSDMQHDEFEQFVLNRTISESNILESSIYSELQFSPSIGGGLSSDTCLDSGRPTAQVPAPQQPPAAAPPTSHAVVDVLNSSACSRESRQSKRTRRKHKSKSKCSVVSASGQRAPSALGGNYPPQYTAIFLDPHHHHHHLGGAANAMGQIASAAASSPFLNAPIGTDSNYLQQQYQFYQQRPMLSSLGAMGHHHHRPLLDAAVPHTAALLGTNPDSIAAGSSSPTNIITTPSTASAISPPLRGSFRKWFSRPSLPFVIGILALGGVACTLGGIVLGSTGLIEHSTQYLSAALLMIGIGVSLLVISGAIWRLSIPDDVDECPCYRHMESCRNCNSPYCNNRLLPGSYLYPEFQHRPPPPSYLTSLNECAAMGLLFHPSAGAQPQQPGYSNMRVNTPPPLYRSTNSLSVYAPSSNTHHIVSPNFAALPPPAAPAVPASHTIINMPPTTNSGSFLTDHNALTMSVVMENLQAQTQLQPLTKEIHYLELD